MPARNIAASARITISPGTMNADAADDRPGGPRTRQAQKIASWVDAGPGQQVAGGDRVLELARIQPAAALDAQFAQQRDVRGRAAEADAADPAPLPRTVPKPHPAARPDGLRAAGSCFPGSLAHRGLTACGRRTRR